MSILTNKVKKQLPYILLVLFLTPSFCWILLDQSVWSWDHAYYAWKTIEIWYSFHLGLNSWFENIIMLEKVRAPGLLWLGQFFVPLGQFLGSIEISLLFFVLLTQFLTLVLVFQIGRSFLPNEVLIPLCGALLTAASPIFIAFSHFYAVESLQLFSVVGFYWIISRSFSWSRLEIAGGLLFFGGLSLAAKITSPLFFVFPGAIVFLAIWRCKKKYPTTTLTKIRCAALLVLGTIVFSGTVVWYIIHIQTVLDYATLSIYGKYAQSFGQRAPFLVKLKYWLTVSQTNLFTPTILACIGSVFLSGLLISFIRRRNKAVLLPWKYLDQVALAAFGEIIIVLVIFSCSVNETINYLFPVMSSVVIIFIWLIDKLSFYFQQITVTFLLLQWICINGFLLNLGFPTLKFGTMITTPRSNQAKKRELSQIINQICCSKDGYRINVLAQEVSWFSVDSLSFYAAKARLINQTYCRFASLARDEHLETAMSKLSSQNIAYLLVLDNKNLEAVLGFYNDKIDVLRNNSSFLSDYKQVPFNSKYHVTIYQHW